MADHATPAPASPPSRIGRYRIVSRIGRGAMGVVYSAFDEVIGRPVALKVLIADLEADPDTRARFYREAQAAARLLHPNIITVYDAGEDQGRSFIAMQLLEGASLVAYLKQPEAAALERKLDLMIQVCEGLAAAHAEGIIHRDLKPSNLFVQADGLLKILDFGVARIADSSMTAAGTMLGTPDYMSPEQARGAQVDARSDVFSAGAVFYFMLAGRKPFPGPDLPAVLHQLQRDDPVSLRGIPPELTTLVSQAMAKAPDHRPGRVEQLLAGLVRFRRQYQAETRRLSVAVRSEFAAASALVESLSEVNAALQLTDPAPVARLDNVRERFPSLTGDVTSIDAVSFERSTVQKALHAVQASQEELAVLVEQRRQWADQLREAHRLLGEHDVGGAQAIADSVFAECPEVIAAKQLAEQCRALAEVQRERVQRSAWFLRAGLAAFDGRDWANAIARARHVLDVDPANVEAAALLQQAEEAAAREDAERLRQRSAEAVRRARAAFRRGRYDQALEQLRVFTEEEPEARSAAAELVELTALRSALAAAAETSGGQIDALLMQAQSAAGAGRFDEAVTLARRAFAIDPTRLDVAEMFDAALDRQVQERIAQEKSRAAEQRDAQVVALLGAAQEHLDRGWIGMALDAATAAERLGGARPDIQSMLERVHLAMRSEDDQAIELTPPVTKPAHDSAGDPGLWNLASDFLRGGFLKRKN